MARNAETVYGNDLAVHAGHRAHEMRTLPQTAILLSAQGLKGTHRSYLYSDVQYVLLNALPLKPGDHIFGLFAAFAVRFDLPDYRGCAFLNACVESGSELELVRECVTGHKDAVRDWIQGKLVEAGVESAHAFCGRAPL